MPITSAQARANGLKGGRPKGYAALQAEKARDFIAKKLEKHFAPIVEKAIEQAIEGNKDARDWLFERAHGRPRQTLGVDGGEVGLPVPIYGGLSISEVVAKKNGLESACN